MQRSRGQLASSKAMFGYEGGCWRCGDAEESPRKQDGAVGALCE